MADIKISQLGEALAVTDNDILPMTASGVTSKVKASTMKSYMVDDLDVSDLHDTTITTPTDDDGLVYNGTSQKWENKQITTKEQWKKNGAYNLCRVTAVTQSLGGLTITVNSDGTVTVGSGTASSLIDLQLNVKTDMTLADGDYRLVGCPNHPYVSLRVVTNDYNTNKVYDYGTGGDFSFSNSTDKNLAVYLRVNSGTVISAPITFKPMITTDLNATYDDYVPHAKTNRDLTELAKSVSYNTLNVADKTGDFSDSITNVPNGEYIAILRIRSKSASGNISTEINLQECTVITNAAQFNHYVSMTKVTVTNNTVTFHSKTYTTATLQDAYIALIPLS